MANFLSQQLISKAPVDKCIVVSGGFTDEERVESSDPTVITENLIALHEEADTRIVLLCIENQSSSIVVAARDTDVLVLLLAHFPKMPCSKIWMKAGTATKRKYIPIHSIVEQLSLDDSAVQDIIAFHALTGLIQHHAY